MQYAKLNADGTYSHQITTSGKVKWDDKNICSAEALFRDGKADQFNVVELYETEPPSFDPATQKVIKHGGEFVGGRWQYRWRVDPLSEEEKAQIKSNNIERLKSKVQERLDDFAKTRGYTNITTACTYTTSSNAVFQSEALYCVYIRDKTWEELFSIVKEIGDGVLPSNLDYQKIEPRLPPTVWPG